MSFLSATETPVEVTFISDNSESERDSAVISGVSGVDLYIGMIGAGGGGKYERDSIAGSGGAGVAQVSIPSNVDEILVEAGNGGEGATQSLTNHSQLNGGEHASVTNSTYENHAGSGGGLVGVFLGNQLSHSQALAVVGSGGGSGNQNNTNTSGGPSGGGLNEDGIGETGGQGNNTHGDPGTLSSGGSRATEIQYGGTLGQDGSALTGGDGGQSNYDPGGGGGAGYYGGGGAADGGGHTAGSGGGGSGFLDTSKGQIIWTGNNSGYEYADMINEFNNAAGTDFQSNGTYGQRGDKRQNGSAGRVVIATPR